MHKEWTPLEFPPWIRWRVRQGATLPERIKDADGKSCCRWCHQTIPKGNHRSAWCSDAHRAMFARVFSWRALRDYIIGRDRICQRCGAEHPGWWETRAHRVWSYSFGNYRGGYVEACPLRPRWEVDHIIPVKDGGTDDPTNLRLTCQRCHIAIGIEQRKARKLEMYASIIT